eukprot:1744948-Prymnesium_polylepis.2
MVQEVLRGRATTAHLSTPVFLALAAVAVVLVLPHQHMKVLPRCHPCAVTGLPATPEQVRSPAPSAPRQHRLPPDCVRARVYDEPKTDLVRVLVALDRLSTPGNAKVLAEEPLFGVACPIVRVGAAAGGPDLGRCVRIQWLVGAGERAVCSPACGVAIHLTDASSAGGLGWRCSAAVGDEGLANRGCKPLALQSSHERGGRADIVQGGLAAPREAVSRPFHCLARVFSLQLQEDARVGSTGNGADEVEPQVVEHERCCEGPRCARDAKGDARWRDASSTAIGGLRAHGLRLQEGGHSRGRGLSFTACVSVSS